LSSLTGLLGRRRTTSTSGVGTKRRRWGSIGGGAGRLESGWRAA
jgi:hypothetical protein